MGKKTKQMKLVGIDGKTVEIFNIDVNGRVVPNEPRLEQMPMLSREHDAGGIQPVMMNPMFKGEYRHEPHVLKAIGEPSDVSAKLMMGLKHHQAQISESFSLVDAFRRHPYFKQSGCVNGLMAKKITVHPELAHGKQRTGGYLLPPKTPSERAEMELVRFLKVVERFIVPPNKLNEFCLIDDSIPLAKADNALAQACRDVIVDNTHHMRNGLRDWKSMPIAEKLNYARNSSIRRRFSVGTISSKIKGFQEKPKNISSIMDIILKSAKSPIVDFWPLAPDGARTAMFAKRVMFSYRHETLMDVPGASLGELLNVKINMKDKNFIRQVGKDEWVNSEGWKVTKHEWMQQETCTFDDTTSVSLKDPSGNIVGGSQKNFLFYIQNFGMEFNEPE